MFGIKKKVDAAAQKSDKPEDSDALAQPDHSIDLPEQEAAPALADELVVADEPVPNTPEPAVPSAGLSSTMSAASRYFKQAPAPILKPSIISEGFELQGDIKSSGGLHVEGRIDGRIEVDNLTIGPKGSVRGEVKCTALNIKGVFDGDAVCVSLSLSGNAVVNGNVAYANLTMSSGTVLTGNLQKV